MIEEFLMPLDRHFDAGFGATADSFHDAAKALDTDDHKHGFGLNRSRLPVFYLYRHANELYLKSMLTMLHRRFCCDFPRFKRDDFPSVTVDGKPRRIFQVHSILHLYEALRTLLNDTAGQIKALGKTDWTKVPEDVENMVKLINGADQASTMFRYPVTLDPLNDAKKSSFKRVDPADAVAKAHHRTAEKLPGVKILALKNDHGEIVETFIYDDQPMPEVFDALKGLAGILSGAQFGMGYEFLQPCSAPEDTPMEAVAEQAGFFAAHGIWCITGGEPLIPMLAFERPGGKREMMRLVSDQLEVGVEQGRQWLADNPEGATHAVLVFDAFITLEGGKTDALVIEARQYQPQRAGFTMAVPYRNPDSPQGFAVFRPKFVGFEGPEPAFKELGEAFFRGVDTHEKGAAVWNAHLDQSR